MGNSKIKQECIVSISTSSWPLIGVVVSCCDDYDTNLKIMIVGSVLSFPVSPNVFLCCCCVVGVFDLTNVCWA